MVVKDSRADYPLMKFRTWFSARGYRYILDIAAPDEDIGREIARFTMWEKVGPRVWLRKCIEIPDAELAAEGWQEGRLTVHKVK